MKRHFAIRIAAFAFLAIIGSSSHAQTPGAPSDAKPAPPPYTFTGNAGIYSQYIFRGLTQTDSNPAFQGGFDFAHSNGFYAGTWASNISWLHDSGVVSHGGSLEWDFYGGYKYAINDDWGLDAGVLYYYYPGSYVAGATKPDTTELYVAASWKWLSLKYSHAISNTFGVPDSRNSRYVDLSANYPITDAITLNAQDAGYTLAGRNIGRATGTVFVQKTF